jgi:DNA-binding CsgD family transcriptional regulator/pimeloyl-ACP methyl ester carboxylesterase
MAIPPPRFRYARSRDGTSIAYARMGRGPSLVIVPPVPLSNVSGEWSVPLIREVHARLASDLEVILYDGRGTGASRRQVDDLSLDALTADLEAVIDAVDRPRTSLLALYLAAVPALAFAARHPGRVERIVLFGAAPDLGRALHRPGSAALYGLIDEDWALFAQTAALDWMGWGAGEAGRLVADSIRTATTPDIARATIAGLTAVDLGPILPDVLAEALVLHRRDGRQLPLAASAELAAALPNGRLHVLDGTSATLFFDDPAGTVDLILSFLRPDRASRPRPEGRADRPPALIRALTPREEEVLRCIAAGDSNAEIAHGLGISVHTVERHAANLYRKIGARGRADAIAWWLRGRPPS